MSTIIERAKAEAERLYPNAEKIDQTIINTTLRSVHKAGATFAATITPEQIEAAARALWNRNETFLWDDADPFDHDEYREDARAAFRAAGFVIEGDQS